MQKNGIEKILLLPFFLLDLNLIMVHVASGELAKLTLYLSFFFQFHCQINGQKGSHVHFACRGTDRGNTGQTSFENAGGRCAKNNSKVGIAGASNELVDFSFSFFTTFFQQRVLFKIMTF